MNKTKTFVATLAVPAALLVLAAQSASAATTPTTTASTVTTPAGYVQLVDDTNHITVTVPNTWTTVQTDPGQNDDGTVQPWILATAGTDLDNFQQTFVDGVLYVGYPFEADPAGLMDRFKLTAGCSEIDDESDNVQPYSDGVFTGLIQVGTDCVGGGATWNMVVASPADQSFTAVLQVQSTDPTALQTVLDSFNIVAGATPGASTTTPGASTTTAAGGVATTTAAGGVATTAVTTPVITPPVQTTTAVTQAVASTVAPTTAVAGPTSSVALTDATLPIGVLLPTDVALSDDTSTIELSVPAAWTATDTAPATNSSGASVPSIVASTDLAAFLPADPATDTFSVPGVIFQAQPFNADAMAMLPNSGLAAVCTDGGTAAYTDGVFTGFFQTWTNCGGGSTEIITLAASPADSSITVTLLIQLPTDDTAALQTVISSFNFFGAGPAGTTAS